MTLLDKVLAVRFGKIGQIRFLGLTGYNFCICYLSPHDLLAVINVPRMCIA